MRRLFASVTWLTLVLPVLVACGQKSEEAPSASVASSPTESTTKAGNGVTLKDGFHKEETTLEATYHWVRQHAVLQVEVPAAGNYRLSFKPVTIFSPTAVSIEVSANGKKAGVISTHGFDFTKTPESTVDATLRAGLNEISLQADRPEAPLSGTDARPAAFGLVLPVRAEPLH